MLKKISIIMIVVSIWMFCGCYMPLFALDIHLFIDASAVEGKTRSADNKLPDFFVDNENNNYDFKVDYEVQRYRQVVLSNSVINAVSISEGETIILDLFEDVYYEAVIDRISSNIYGTISLRARIKGYDKGYILISTTGQRSLATIRIPELEELYLIKSDPITLTHYLLDIGDDNRNYLESGPPLTAPDNNSGERRNHEERDNTQLRNPGPDDPATIDVMIVYTPAAANWANQNGGGIANVVSQTMELSQLAHDNSGTIVNLSLVHSTLIEYVESGSSSTDLRRLTFREDWDPWGYEGGPPWYMEDVHDWRDEYGADMVALLALVNDVGGIAWQLNRTEGYPELGFSLTRVQQAANTYTFVHELGHIMGCHHHRDQNVQPGPGLFNYSAGWRWTGMDNNRYCSVMSYDSGQYFPDGNNHTRVAYFSNPEVNYQDVATGHATLGDNSRTIREIKHVIAGYRHEVEPISELPWNESFEEEIFPPEGWVQNIISGTTQWQRRTGGYNNYPAGAADGNFNAYFYHGARQSHTAHLITPPFDVRNYVNIQLSFWHAQRVWAGDQDHLSVYYSDNPSGEWHRLAQYTHDIPNWTYRSFNLPDTLDTVYIKFEAIANWGYGVVLDDIRLTVDDRPTVARNPFPVDNSTGVSLNIEELSWDYIADTLYVNPLGFRVYMNTTGVFSDDDDFEWIPYIDDQTEYSTSEILPEQLDNFTKYYWKVVPTTREPGRDGYRRSRIAAWERNQELDHRSDARNVAVWKFWTGGDIDSPDVNIKIIMRNNVKYVRLDWERVNNAVCYAVYRTPDVSLEIEDWEAVGDTTSNNRYEEEISDESKTMFYRVIALWQRPILADEEIRIILTWGDTPRDLDSHLTGPIPGSESRFHIYFGNRTFSHDGDVYARLDRDVTNSYGPETITIYSQTSGLYRYSVHDYTNRNNNNSFQLSNSSARVAVWEGTQLLRNFHVPANNAGNVWRVFELEGNQITPINTISNSTDYRSDQQEVQYEMLPRK